MRIKGSCPQPTILVLGHDASNTGAPRLCARFVDWLRRHTQYRAVILLGAGGELVDEFSRIAPTMVLPPDRSSWNLSSVVRFAGGLPDAILANTVASSAMLDFVAPLQMRTVAYVHELQMMIEQCLPNGRLGETFRKADAFIAASDEVKDNLVARHGIASEKIVVVPPALPIAEIFASANSLDREMLCKTLSLPLDAILIGACGTTDWRKGPDLFIQLAAYLTRRLDRDDRLRFVWIGCDDASLKRLSYDAEKSGVIERVVFLGSQPDAIPYINAFDIFVSTSREDPNPVVCIEAALLGKPIVAFNGAGGAGKLIGTDAGIVVPYLDVAGMAEAVSTLCKDPRLRTRMGQVGTSRIQDQYSFETCGPRIVRALEGGIDSTDRAEMRPMSRVELVEPPMISVVVPSFNHGQYVETALNSVWSQSYQNVELIIVDDGSSDGSPDLIRRLVSRSSQKDRTRCFFVERNRGAHNAINFGLSKCRGDLLTILNSDDFYYPRRLDRLYSEYSNAVASSRKPGFLFTDLDLIDSRGKKIVSSWRGDTLKATEALPGWGFRLMAANLVVTTGNIFLDRAHFDEVGPFANYRMVHDWDFLLRAVFLREPIMVQERLMAYRVHSENTIQPRAKLTWDETRSVMTNFYNKVFGEIPVNPLCPSPDGFPGYFEDFVKKGRVNMERPLAELMGM